MSYSQIFRRIRRMMEAGAKDALNHLSKEQRDLFDFDELLKKRAPQGPGPSERAKEQSGQRTSQQRAEDARRSTSQQAAGGSQSSRPQGKRKPGERDDGYYLQKLGLGENATNDEIKKAYRRLLSQYHPDRVATLSIGEQERATEKAKDINEAYQILARRRSIH